MIGDASIAQTPSVTRRSGMSSVASISRLVRGQLRVAARADHPQVIPTPILGVTVHVIQHQGHIGAVPSGYMADGTDVSETAYQYLPDDPRAGGRDLRVFYLPAHLRPVRSAADG